MIAAIMAITAIIASRSRIDQRSASLDTAETSLDYKHFRHKIVNMWAMTWSRLHGATTQNAGTTTKFAAS